MIKHIVMFKLAEKTEANLNELVNLLRNMEGKIEPLKFIEVGVDFKQSPRSYDVVLTTHFADKDALATYAAHPVHLPVLDRVKELCSGVGAVDYEI